MNKFTTIGRLTKDVEMKYVNNNMAIANFSIAVNRKYAKQGEEKKADFFNCKAFGKLAEHISKWFQKGDPIAIIGRIEIEPFSGQDGKKVYFTNLMIDEVFFAGPVKKQSNHESNDNKQDELPWG